MVIESNGFQGKVINLNFYGAYPYPNTNGDIDPLIANSLYYLTTPQGGGAVPEPASATAGLMLSAFILARRTRKKENQSGRSSTT